MITDEQINLVATILATPLHGVLVRRALEAYENSKPKPEPFVYYKKQQWGYDECDYDDEGSFPLYDAPPTRKPLSEVEINDIIEDVLPHGTMLNLVREIEQAHGIGCEQ